MFSVSGRGWGHGVGMSQWGAQGFAQRGTGYAGILAHYYRGTQLGRAPVARLRVLLTDGKKALRVSSDVPFRVRDGAGELHDVDAGTYALGPGLRLRVVREEKPVPLPGPLLFSPTAGGVLRLDAKPYRGQLELGVERGRLRAINHVGLEAYLYGVVPDEMPHTWHVEALKAQAVVARSYALAVRRSGGTFDLYDDVRSQVYNGISAEELQSNAAVDSTAGQVLLHGGAIARTFFFSTSGGRTANVADVWDSAPIPYLVSVADPYDSASPHHRWGPIAVPAAQLRRALAVPGEVVDVRTTLNGSGRVESVTGHRDGGRGLGDGSRPPDAARTPLDLVLGRRALARARTAHGRPARLGDAAERHRARPRHDRARGAAVQRSVGACGRRADARRVRDRRQAEPLHGVPARERIDPDGAAARRRRAAHSARAAGRAHCTARHRPARAPRTAGCRAAPGARPIVGAGGHRPNRRQRRVRGTARAYARDVPRPRRAWARLRRRHLAGAQRRGAVIRAAALAVAATALLMPAPAQAARFAVGLDPDAAAGAVAARLAADTGGTVARDLLALRTLVLTARSARGVAALPGVAWVERIDRPRRLAFTPTDPLAARQWYLAQIRAFDSWPERPAFLPGVRVAIVDSGLDARHPEFEGRVVGGRSFVRGSWRRDDQGHGTFVAGLIAANHDNGRGIAGLAFPAELLVAKVIGKQRTISVEAEARAITWAANAGARVINLSLGGLRDPLDPSRDSYSALEAAAVSYAVKKGAVVVAAVGNADEAPERPWSFASYPAALPHVIGVSALGRDGAVPPFSNRDKIYNDLAAPGQEIVSTFPRGLTRLRRACANQGYSDCAPDRLRSYRHAEGTSFAAPLVTAAAALVLGVNGDLRPDQVRHVLTRGAVDLAPESGCKLCPAGRDELSGWGRLDVTEAVALALEPGLLLADRREPNDDAGPRNAWKVYGRRGNRVDATLDFWDDQNDVYAVYVRPGQRLAASLDGPPGARLFLWKPGTRAIDTLSVQLQRRRVAQSVQRGERQRFAYQAPASLGGWYYLQVKLVSPGAGPYRLSFTKR